MATTQGEQLSPDGLYRWDGVRWVPRAGVIPQPVPVVPPSPPGTRLAIAGAVVAMVGAVAVIVACLVPYATITDTSASQTTPSIFNPGFSGGLWYAAEPVAVTLVAIAAGVMLIVFRSRVPRALAAGALLAFGVQTTFLFMGYVGSAANGQSEQLGIGGVIGVLGGLAIIVGGVLAAVSLSVYNRMAA